MSIGTQEILTPAYVPELPPDDLLSEDGEPLESQWHLLQILLLLECVNERFRARDDYFAGGNMFLYFDAQQLRNRRFRGPDFFFVKGVSKEPLRKYWAVWKEGGRYPDMILELLSPTTAVEDRGPKKDTYEQVFRTRELFLADPDKRALEGFRLGRSIAYETINASTSGRLWCDELGAFLGWWDGEFHGNRGAWVRLFDEQGNLWPTKDEEIARLRAQIDETRT